MNPEALITLFNSNPARYKSPVYGQTPLSDGYLPTPWLVYQLTTPDSGRTAPNPRSSPAMVQPSFTAASLIGAIASASFTKVFNHPTIVPLMGYIKAGDYASVLALAAAHEAAGNMTAADLTAVQTLLAPVADPSWTPTVPVCDLYAEFGVESVSAAYVDAALGRQ